MKKSISLSLIALLLLESCVVYQKIPIALSEAHDRGKVKVITNTDEKLKFKKIIIEDSVYYGFDRKKLKNEYGEFEWVDITRQLNVDVVEAIYLKDRKKSIVRTVFLVLATPLVIILGTFLFWAIIGPPI